MQTMRESCFDEGQKERERSLPVVMDKDQIHNQLSGPKDLNGDAEGNLYVVDSWNVQVNMLNLTKLSKLSVKQWHI